MNNFIEEEKKSLENVFPMNPSAKDKFRMTLNVPKILRTINSSKESSNDLINLDFLQFNVRGTVAPKKSIPPVELKFKNQSVAISSYVREKPDELKIKFRLDENYLNYWVIDRWLDFINHEKTAIFNEKKLNNDFLESKYGKYLSDFSIEGLNLYNKPVIKFDYIGCFPTYLSELEYDYSVDDPSEIFCEANFSFSRYHTKLLSE